MIRTVRATAGEVHDVKERDRLLHGEKLELVANAGLERLENRPDANPEVLRHVARRPAKKSAG